MNAIKPLSLMSALGILALAACMPFISEAQSTGTMVDPSVPAGVSPNPHTLEGAQLPATGPTPRRTFKRDKILPAGNAKNHVTGGSFAAPVQSDSAKPTPVPTN